MTPGDVQISEGKAAASHASICGDTVIRAAGFQIVWSFKSPPPLSHHTTLRPLALTCSKPSGKKRWMLSFPKFTLWLNVLVESLFFSGIFTAFKGLIAFLLASFSSKQTIVNICYVHNMYLLFDKEDFVMVPKDVDRPRERWPLFYLFAHHHRPSEISRKTPK